MVLSGNGLTDIEASEVVASDDGKRLAARFILSNAELRLRNLVIRTKRGDVHTKASTFTIEEGKGGDTWLQINGRTTVRSGRSVRYSFSFGTIGNVDLEFTPLWIYGVPKDATWSIPHKLLPELDPEHEEEHKKYPAS